MARIIYYCLMLLFLPTLAWADVQSSPASGYALAFDYSQYATIPNSDSLNPGRITAECWVKFRTLDGHAQFFICKGGAKQGAYNLYLMDGSVFVFELDGYSDHRVDCPPVTLNAGKWYHVAGVYDGNRIRVVLNGETIGEKEIGYVRIGTTDPLFLNHHLDYPWVFSGDLDEVRIWSAARTDEDIKSAMDIELSSAPMLAGAWHLNEGTGQTIRDSAGGHDGYLGANPNVDENDPKWKESDIQFGNFAVLSPAGGEIWQSGTSHTILWRAGDTNTLRIEYSTDGGDNWSVITDNADASIGSYSWTLPQIQSFRCRVRITDVAELSKTDESSRDFTISPPFVRLSFPTGGERWESGRVETITWTALSIERIKIEYSTDDGGTWHDISIVDAASGYYVWTVPSVQSENCLVRISDHAVPERTDTVNSVFTIRKTNWTSYSTANGLVSNDINALAVDDNGVLWFGSRDKGVSRFDGVSWQTYNTSNSGIVSDDFLWIEPDREGKMWFGSTWNGVSCYDGKNWVNYSQVSNVRGIAVDFKNVKWFGEYSNGLSSFDGVRWNKYTTPSGPLSNDCEVVMFDNTDNSIWVGYGISAIVGVSHFNGSLWKHYSTRDGLVNNAISAMVVDKDGVRWFGTDGGVSSFDGNTWKNYTGMVSYPIKAAAVDMNNVKWFGTSGGGAISFDGITWRTYTTQNSGICSNDIVRTLVDKQNGVWFASRTNGVSRFYSETGPYINLSSPNGGEKWTLGSVHTITWYSHGVDRINIEYSTENGATWHDIGIVNAASGKFDWTIPLIESENCLVRVTSKENSSISDTSDAVFAFVLVTSMDEEIPIAFSLYPVSPNPFNPSTTISFTLPSSTLANLIIYDIAGRRVNQLFSDYRPTGAGTAVWDGKDDSGRPVSSGVYIARLSAGKNVAVGKMLLVK